MASIIIVKSVEEPNGDLTVIENELPFEIRRIFFITRVPLNEVRGGHGHFKAVNALIAVSGSCDIYISNHHQSEIISLNSRSKCLILNPEDWHTMQNFSEDAVLLVMSSEIYDKKDYFYEEPEKN